MGFAVTVGITERGVGVGIDLVDHEDRTFTLIRHTVAVAILAGAVGDVAGVGNTVDIAVGITFVRDAVAVTIIAAAIGDIAVVGAAVAIAVVFAFIGHTVGIAVF